MNCKHSTKVLMPTELQRNQHARLSFQWDRYNKPFLPSRKVRMGGDKQSGDVCYLLGQLCQAPATRTGDG